MSSMKKVTPSVCKGIHAPKSLPSQHQLNRRAVQAYRDSTGGRLTFS